MGTALKQMLLGAALAVMLALMTAGSGLIMQAATCTAKKKPPTLGTLILEPGRYTGFAVQSDLRTLHVLHEDGTTYVFRLVGIKEK